MKKVVAILIFVAGAAFSASAQVLPNIEFGAKAGFNLTSLQNTASATFNSNNRAGYLAGFWARIGALGSYFQPEVYLTSKNVSLHQTTSSADGANEQSNTATFTSLDVPLLFGARFGAMGNAIRINTGPLFSFAINKNQSTGEAFYNATHLNYSDQNYGWQFGLGADIRQLSIDLRYEAGLNRVSTDYGEKVHINLFNLTLGYKLFGL